MAATPASLSRTRTTPASGTGGHSWGLTAATALAPAAWGTTYLVTTELLPPDRPMLAGALRALPAGLIVLALTRTLPSGSWWWRATVLGTLNIGAFFALLFTAAYRLPGGVAATLLAIQPLLVAFLAAALVGERLTRWRVLWGLAGVAGVALMVFRSSVALDAVGVAAGLAATLVMALGIVLTKRWQRPVGLLPFTGWQLVAGGLLLAPLTLLVEGPPPALDPAAVGGYTWLALGGTLAAYLLWFRGLDRLPVGALSFLALLSPLVATVLGWAVLGQALTAFQLVGFVLTLTAVTASQWRPAR